jgi:hypothetical protein
MKKYLRFLLIFIFFSLLPAFLIKNGSAIYFNFIEEQRNEEIFSLQRNYLKEIQNRLLLKTDRQHIALQIRKDISQLAS